ncbi:MAG: TetR/AcrR family transcriptional regulator [Alicyclobacillaceae bacterium]|uniref:TetR/AcrR family transcriptional regulator n=1 Tax=Alicyclobacillus sp. SP_1 TaxID=2942475 RepID=UPI0021582137|nr:TetR/AcrR family transcriptional regulator [Alicyclobacillus sp. SP_1]MCY0887022.1 TetR/AcrR family transcriptional regulator [Alicyclobacillaceae bacterium]MCY0897141.1 TetR/AcrR family transcriptional regulator [Alicyclobacillaceae bacterium]
MAHSESQKAQIRQLFIDATARIIEEEGIENVTIRKIADLAGFNSATIYNYFDELSHLVFFASMKFLKRYTDDLPHYMARAQDVLDEYLLIWECFCHHSFRQPQIYHAIFGANLGDVPGDILRTYYNQSPEDLDNFQSELIPMFLEPDLKKRSEISLRKCIAAGYVAESEAAEINELVVLVYHGMFSLFLNNRRSYTVEEATKRTVRYIRGIVCHSHLLLETSPTSVTTP